MLKRNASSITHQRSNVSQAERGVSGRVALAVAVAMSAAAAAHAQTAPRTASSDALEEIVVTATRRAESIQDVPVSVTAFSQEQMDVQGVKAVDDIARLAPGIQFTRGGGFGSDLSSSISIRGVASMAGQSTTGIYIDDTPIQVGATVPSGNFSVDAYPQLFDLQRVEVLRGPQGTLFGSGSEGGTIRFITPPPSLTKSSLYVRSELSSTQYGDPSYELGVAGGAPIVEDKLGYRASFWTRRDGGYVDAVDYYTGKTTSPNNNWRDSFSGRVAFGWAPVDNLLITPSLYYQKIKQNGTGTFYLNTAGARVNPADPTSAALPYPNPWGNEKDGQYVDLHQVPQWGIQRLALPALKVDYSFGKVDLVSNTSYYDRAESGETDYTQLEGGLFNSQLFPNPEWAGTARTRQSNRFFTQELRLQSNDAESPFKWVAGAFYSHTNTIADVWVDNPHIGDIENAAPPPRGGCGTAAQCVALHHHGLSLIDGRYAYINTTTVRETQKAAFAQLDYEFVKHFIATVGVRHSKMTYDFVNVNGGPNSGVQYPYAAGGSTSASVTTPKYMLSYKTDGALVYLSATKGFRNGGSNPPVVQDDCFKSLDILGIKSLPQAYNPDQVWSYELGTKFTTDKGRLTVDASVFQVNWKNQIQNVSLPTCVLSFTMNIGQAQSRGFDLDVQWRALDSLLLSLNGGYQYIKATQTIPSGGTNIITNGDALPGSQPVVNAAAQYSFVAWDRPSYFRVDYNYTGRSARGAFFNPMDASYPYPPSQAHFFLAQDPPTKQANVRLGTQFGEWDVSVFCNNLFNSQPLLDWNRSSITFANVPTGIISANTLRPRTTGVTATLRF